MSFKITLGEAGIEAGFNEDFLQTARRVAQEMTSLNEIIRKIPFGNQQGDIWLSSDPTLVVGTEKFVLDGKEFYIGVFKADQVK